MEKKCIICGKPGNFGYFEGPDEFGIVGMFSHITGTITGPFGSSNTYDRHFVTLEQLKQTDWFDEFLKQRKEAYDKEAERINREWEIAYSRDFYIDEE